MQGTGLALGVQGDLYEGGAELGGRPPKNLDLDLKPTSSALLETLPYTPAPKIAN